MRVHESGVERLMMTRISEATGPGFASALAPAIVRGSAFTEEQTSYSRNGETVARQRNGRGACVSWVRETDCSQNCVNVERQLQRVSKCKGDELSVNCLSSWRLFPDF